MSNEQNTTGSPDPQPDVLEVRGDNSLDQSTEHEQVTPPGDLSRRQFLHKLSLALGGVGTALVGLPVVAFIVGPLFTKNPDEWRSVGAADQFKVGETTQVAFEDSSPVPWAGVTARNAAWLRRESTENFTAFAVNCSHLGCPVSWLAGPQLFLCPCHGGAYYRDGSVAAGPPPQSLARYETRLRSGQVEIKASGTPIPKE